MGQVASLGCPHTHTHTHTRTHTHTHIHTHTHTHTHIQDIIEHRFKDDMTLGKTQYNTMEVIFHKGNLIY